MIIIARAATMERNQFFHARLVESASCNQSGRCPSRRPNHVPRRAGGSFSPEVCRLKPCGVVFRGVFGSVCIAIGVPSWSSGSRPLSSTFSSWCDTCTNLGAGMERAEWKDARSESGVSGGALCAPFVFMFELVYAALALSAAEEDMITSSRRRCDDGGVRGRCD